MEKSKTRPVSDYVKPSSTIFSISLAFCFAALIHVEIELHAHRETLKVLHQERENNNELRKVVGRHENVTDSVLKMLQSGSSNSIGVRAGGARGAAAPQILGNSDFLGSERKFGQSQFLKTFPCFLNHYFEEINFSILT